ncbi:hypothetical protein SAMN05421510_10053 [Nitrosomonas ureae]|uniref:Uncharacterized protein n=1 Tax=Nitrosomonas ureae TaxID=44577 RepID=A0A1H9AU59_9PROT|nr:hypothetical protein SAMN05421510_10053 [Nitrosomonas ureae]
MQMYFKLRLITKFSKIVRFVQTYLRLHVAAIVSKS